MLALAALAVVAFGAAAATLDSAEGTGAGGAGDGVGVGDGEEGFSFGGFPANQTTPDSGVDIPPILLRAAMTLLVAVALLGFAFMLYDEGLTVLARLAGAAVLGVLLAALIYALIRAAGDTGDGGLFGSGSFSLPSGGAAGTGDLASTVVSNPPAAAVAVLGIAVLVAAVVLVQATDDAPAASTEPPADPEPTATAAAVGRAAGRAADRIEADAAVDNAVYRAWREMTDDLELPRETSTPGEFADAAVAAGMAPTDVRELTTLFEDVRYGGEAADEEREQRALAALRRIEDAYGERR